MNVLVNPPYYFLSSEQHHEVDIIQFYRWGNWSPENKECCLFPVLITLPTYTDSSLTFCDPRKLSPVTCNGQWEPLTGYWSVRRKGDWTVYFLFPLALHPVSCNGTPLQYSCLENPMDGGAWKAAVHGVAEGRTQLSDFTFTFHFHALEKEMATHSSVFAWRIPGTGEPSGLPSMGSHRVGHDWSDLAAAAESKMIFSIRFSCYIK